MKKKRVKAGWVISVFPIVITIAVLWMTIINSFADMNLLGQMYGMTDEGSMREGYAEVPLMIRHLSLEQYRLNFFMDPDFWYYFWNSMGLCIPTLLGGGILSVGGGYAFSRFRFPGKKILFFLYILVMLIPYQVMLIPQYLILDQVGAIGNMGAVILSIMTAPFGTYLIYQFSCQIPKETIEAAEIDGAGEWNLFFSVVLPQLKDGIASLAILNFVDIWNTVEQPLLFLKNEFQYPLSAAFSYLYPTVESGSFSGSTVFLLPMILLFLMGSTYLKSGIGNSVVRIGKEKG